MDPKTVLEQAVDKLGKYVQSAQQKHDLAEKAGELHRRLTGHHMKFDKDDNPVTTGPEAEQCPALQHKQQ